MSRGAYELEGALKKAYRSVFVLGIAGIAGIVMMAAAVEAAARLGGLPVQPSEAGQMLKFTLTGLGAAGVFLLIFISASKKRLDPSQAAKYVGKLYYYDVVTVIACEMPATMGVCLFFITGERPDFYMNAALSVVFFIFFFPRSAAWLMPCKEKQI